MSQYLVEYVISMHEIFDLDISIYTLGSAWINNLSYLSIAVN